MNSKESIEVYVKSIADLTKIGYSINWVEGVGNDVCEHSAFSGSLVTFIKGPHEIEYDLTLILDASTISGNQENMRDILDEQFTAKESDDTLEKTQCLKYLKNWISSITSYTTMHPIPIP